MNDQTLPLFRWSETRPVVAPTASEQAQNLARVEGRIAESIIRWCSRHVGAEFHLSEMTADIMAETMCAPDSPRRILLQLRDSGQVEVECVDRATSAYRLGSVR